MTGTVQILNVGLGDLSVCFNDEDPKEVERAKKVVEDLLRSGYALFVEEEDGTQTRVESFDPEHFEYIVMDVAPKRVKTKRRVPSRRSKAIAIAPTAGG